MKWRRVAKAEGGEVEGDEIRLLDWWDWGVERVSMPEGKHQRSKSELCVLLD